MRVRIYDSKVLGGKSWFLGAGNLYDYLSHLRADFFLYKIQRRLVINKYLDSIYKTIEQGEPIPPITLIYNKNIAVDDGLADLDLQSIDILDGLQRTYRLWVIYKIGMLCEQLQERTSSGLLNLIKANCPDLLELDFVNLRFLKQMVAEENGHIFIDWLIEKMKEFDMTFTIWTGLTEEEIVKKMLILNAGQRPVSATHQFELIFMRYFDANKLQFNSKIKLYREKDREYDKVKKGDRQEGEFLFSSVVISLLSYISQKPMRVSIDKIIQWDNDNYLTSEEMTKYFNHGFLSQFVDAVYAADCEACKKHTGKGQLFPEREMLSWFGKDTTMSGVFAALGAAGITISNFASRIGRVEYKLLEFNEEYQALSSVRVNVGNEVRRAVFQYVKAQLDKKPISWAVAFRNNKHEYAQGEPLF